MFTAAVDGRVYARHGTTTETRLTVIDRTPADDPTVLPASAGLAPDVATLLAWVNRDVPARAVSTAIGTSALPALRKAGSPARNATTLARPLAPAAVELAYAACDWAPAEGRPISEAFMRPTLSSRSASPARRLIPHRSSSRLRWPRSHRPSRAIDRTCQAALVAEGLLSEAQLETVVYAGEAHGGHLTGSWTVDETFRPGSRRA